MKSSEQGERFQTLRKKYLVEGDLNYLLHVFGHTLAEREGYMNADGVEAIRIYLINKHHWLPRDVRSMSHEDLQIALHVEMQGWTAPPEAR